MRIIIFGQPGSGKGTQSKKLEDHFSIIHLSMGDILRQAVRSDDSVGLTAKKYMNEGLLVPDPLVIKMLVNILGQGSEHKNGFILDGYPRTIAQANYLDKNSDDLGGAIDVVVYLHIEDNVLLDRLSGRLISESTGEEYHIKYKPPKVAGRCDIDGSKLIQRDDDKPEMVLNRLKVFRAQSEPLIDYYNNKGILKKIDATGEIQEVTNRLISSLSK
ncbi:MAG: adenylate kinase [SAR324 cluster bacterium]|nr:adenylate kinase [SAR324 cluster bacterium]